MRETQASTDSVRRHAVRGVQWPRYGRSLRAMLTSCALTPGLAHACVVDVETVAIPLTMFFASLAWVLVLTVVLGLITDLAARQWAWHGWLGVSLLTRWSHIAAGLATLSLAVVALAVMRSFQEVFLNFGADLPALTVWMFKLRWLMPLALPLWAAGLWRARWRLRPTWSLSWALAGTLGFGAVAGSMYLPIFKLGCMT